MGNNSNRNAVVAGASGVAGRGIALQLASAAGWSVTALSRSPVGLPGTRTLACDLADPSACRAGMAECADTTHLFYAAYLERPDAQSTAAVNVAMLSNTIEGLLAAGAPLAHVTVIHGAKVYGAHLGPYMTPARESDPRHAGTNFYFEQEDLLRALACSHGLRWTILRPRSICGFALGNPMNIVVAIAVYATVCKLQGRPLHFPGTAQGYQSLRQAINNRLLGHAAEFVAARPECAGRAYNVTNGDLFRWSRLWPQVAAYFDLDVAEPADISLQRDMPQYEELWREYAKSHGLVYSEFSRLVSWRYADSVFSQHWDNLVNDIDLRLAGFHSFEDTEQTFRECFDELKQLRVIA